MKDQFEMQGLWCVFPIQGGGETPSHDAVKIGQVEEVGLRQGIPSIRFRAEHNPQRTLEILGSWSVRRDHKG